MSAEMVQMNVRIPKDLKESVDEVLQRCKLTSSEVVRSLWKYIQKEQSVPQFEKPTKDKSNEGKSASLIAFENRPGLQDAIAEYLGIDKREVILDDIPFDELKEMAYNERYEEKQARCTL